MSRWSPAGGSLPAEREPWYDPAIVLGSSGPTRVARDDDADPGYEPPRIRGFSIANDDGVTLFRYFPDETVCNHPRPRLAHVEASSSSGGYVGAFAVLWCPDCEQLVGPAPEPQVWQDEGDQA